MDAKIGLIVTINRFVNYSGHKYFKAKTVTTMCKTLEDAHSELVRYLCSQFKDLNIDFPIDINEFELLWFDREYIETHAFTYKVFNNKWMEPWEMEDIYSDVMDLMFDTESKNPPDFSELYGEPNPDEIKEDKFVMQPEENKELDDIQSKVDEIINLAKTAIDDKQSDIEV
jgi:hypothetical protein